jgi:hypothetical protein
MRILSQHAAEQQATALDPNTEPAKLLQLATPWPDEVLQNPVLPLLLLEDPRSGIVLRDAARQSRAERDVALYAARATLRTRRAWLVDSIARILPHFEALHPEDKRPRYTLEVILEAERNPIPFYVMKTAMRTKINHTEKEHLRCFWTANAVALSCSSTLSLQLQAVQLASQVAEDSITEREWQANEIVRRVQSQRKRKGCMP